MRRWDAEFVSVIIVSGLFALGCRWCCCNEPSEPEAGGGVLSHKDALA